MSYKRYIIFSLLVALPVVFINVTNAAYANSVSVLNIVSTTLFLVAWMVYGFYAGYNKAKSFLVFNFIFWSLNLVITIIHNIKDIEYLYLLPVYTSFIPMYGVYYLIVSSHMVSRLLGYCLLLIPPIICSILGYLLGLMKYNSLKKRIQR